MSLYPGGPPDKLNDRHRLIAYLSVAGFTNRAIAEKLSMNEGRISIIRGSPLFAALCDQLRKEIREGTIGGVVDRLIREGPKNLDVLVDIRDGVISDSDGAATRARVAQDLLDRNPATAKISRTEGEQTVRVQLDVTALHLMASAVAEDEGRPTPSISVQAAALPAGIRARTIDEAIEAYEEAEK